MANQYYHYEPSLAAAAIFVALYVISSGTHTYQLIKSRTWYFIPFLVGCLLEAIGYLGRVINAKETPDWTLGPFIMQALLLLLGPPFYAASIYMILGRMIRLLEADHHSIVRTNWMTKIFVFGDVVSILAQGFGGTRLANATTQSQIDLGQTIIIVGLAVQIIFFGLFIIGTSIFHYRINRDPTEKSLRIPVNWRRLLHVLYATSILILIRSIFRVVEYVTGRDGELQSKEIYLYLFDGLLMFIVAIIFNIFHPSRIVQVPRKDRLDSSDSHIQLEAHGARAGGYAA